MATGLTSSAFVVLLVGAVMATLAIRTVQAIGERP